MPLFIGAAIVFLIRIMRYVFAVACEVSNMADVMLRDTMYSRLAAPKRIRRVPKIYGILTSILTTLEYSKLHIISDELAGIEGLTHRCLMYGGCVVEFDSAYARKALIDSPHLFPP